MIAVIDTETTGLGPDDEILQCSIINGEGTKLFNSFFKPVRHESWPEAEAVNRISPASVAACPSFQSAERQIASILGKAQLIIGYNVRFDLGMLAANSALLSDLISGFDFSRIKDVMHAYAWINARENGLTEASDGTPRAKWQKLISCAAHYGFSFGEDGRFHDSLGDCLATLHCYRKIIETGDAAYFSCGNIAEWQELNRKKEESVA